MAQNSNEVNFGVFLGSGLNMNQIAQDLNQINADIAADVIKGEKGDQGNSGPKVFKELLVMLERQDHRVLRVT